MSTGASRPVVATEMDTELALDPPERAPGADLALVNSAQVAVGGVLEDAGFIARPDGALFVVLHRPADQQPRGLLTICGSLFAEQHTDYRREVQLARELACAGVAVARFHYRGVGNSAPGSASLEAFCRDALDVTMSARRVSAVGRIAFLGVGMGSLVASKALLAHPDARLMLWKPVLDGTQFFRDFFRARLIASARIGGAKPVSTDELLATLQSTGHVDVMGFKVAASLYDSVTSSRLAETIPDRPRRVLIRPFQGSRAARLEPLVAQWRALGSHVDVEPVKLAEDPWFIPDGPAVAAVLQAAEEQLISTTRDWLLDSWTDDE